MAGDMGLETKFTALGGEVRATAGPGGIAIEGYASLFGVADQGGDVVAAGAYRRSLAALTARGGRVKMLWQHDPAEPIGVWDEVIEDDRGLWVKGRLLPEIARAKEAATLISAGAIDGLSIGYRTIKADRDAAGKRNLREVELWEVSLVTFPMLTEARVGSKEDAAIAVALGDLAAQVKGARQELGRRR